MPTRRSFLAALGTGSAAAALGPSVTARGFEAFAAALTRGDPAAELMLSPAAGPGGAAAINLASNENPRGACKDALAAIAATLAESNRYPYALPPLLRADLARLNGVAEDQVLLGCGSSEILRVAVDAFTGPLKPLVTASPTYEAPVNRAASMGTPVFAVPVRHDLSIDLGAIAARVPDAGLVFICNPNNPTGTLHPATAIADFVRDVLRQSPAAVVLIDEAYHEYVDHPDYASALPLALESPRVVVSRTFSKAYGLAGLRVGYVLGNAATLRRMARFATPLALNVLGVAAARASLADRALPARERRLNGEARAHTHAVFSRAGYRVIPSQTNFIMVDVRRDARAFQEEARAAGVLVGRPFPPLTTWSRISIGTMDEMQEAGARLVRVLGT